MNKQALLIVAHGSRRQQSNDEIRQITQRVSEQAGGRFTWVDCAFLELTEPSIADGIEALIAAGADDIIVMPYFLAAGRHVTEDIPAIVQQKQTRHPQVILRLSPYLGSSPVLTDLILATVERGQCACVADPEKNCTYPVCLQGDAHHSGNYQGAGYRRREAVCRAE